jgi:MFS family permease
VHTPLNNTFRSLRNFNYRLWFAGSVVSNVGTWMQRVAQDWMVLTVLTHNSATAVGIVMALQFGPHFLLLPVTGFAADHFDRRKLLFATQAAQGALALVLGVLTIANVVELWHVYAFAFMLGCVTAFDSPSRQTFVAELVGEADLSNAVALNSASFHAARMVGPAAAGVLIAVVGSGWAFLFNAASFGAVLASIVLLRRAELHPRKPSPYNPGDLVAGIRYVWQRPDLKAVLLMVFLISTFGLNFPIFISTMSVTAFGGDAGQFGLLTSMMGVGSVAGALGAASRPRPRLALIFWGAAIFGIGCALAAIMPNYWLFGLVLVGVGASAQTFNTTSNATMQLSTAPNMRGRVMAIFMAIALGTTPLGAPLVGRVADAFGPRVALGVAAASGIIAAMVCIDYLVRHRKLRLQVDGRSLRLSTDSVKAMADKQIK